MLAAWVALPALLGLLVLGWGSLVEAAGGRRLPLALLPALGLAAIVVVAQFLTLADATAELTVPVVAALAVAGLARLAIGRLARPEGWALAAVAATFAVYAATIVASGEPTFAGYIRLDDTATWMALTDRVMEHGRSLDGLAPSSYEATLAVTLADGYPIGVFLPLGVGAALVGQDVAWLVQPYMAWLGALLALALWSLATPLVASRPLRALVAFVAAQPALLVGYYLWGGIKELAAAALIATAAALAGRLLADRLAARMLVPFAFVCAALAGVLSGGGLIWLIPALALLTALGLRRLPLVAVAARGAVLIGLVAALGLPVLVAGDLLPPTSAPLTDAGARGNLIAPLEPAQVAGIWPAGDFRFDPVDGLPVDALIAVALIAAAGGLAVAWRARAWGALAYVAGMLAAAGLICAIGSPWVDAKALATASPAIPFAAMIAGAALVASRRRIAGGALLAALAVGVLWSNALAYRDANLAPYDQFAELERVGERIAGQGPTLMTEYQPYGVRHFLRDADPEGASELRRRRVELAAGGMLAKGESADTDALDPGALFVYRTLVLRRSPAQSRPPAAYRLHWRGDYYEVWQREAATAREPRRLALGGPDQPVGRPGCGAVAGLAAEAGPGGELIAARRAPAIAASLARASYPREWSIPGDRAHPIPRGAGTVAARVEVQRRADYEVWLRGSIRAEAELLVDGHPAGEIRHQLENRGQYVRLGSAALERGAHLIELRVGDADLHPGSGGAPAAIGPLVLASADAADARLVRVDASRARSLCRRRWDWIEVAA
ncbi:MAG: hypothetical protein GEU88_17225 [Solirubrobacterales bacterium]|nr:hypothetical protein [Solirubrobacterales bacterium]